MLGYLLVVHVLPFTWTISLPKPPQVGELVQETCNDLDFGNAQVGQFMRDRPRAADIIRRHEMLRWMLTWHFAGELRRDRIYWDHREPEEAKALHFPTENQYPSLIRVSKNQPAVDQCATLLFELFNSEIDAEYQLLLLAPADSRKSKDDFVTRCVRDEFKAAQKVQWFFIHHPIHGANATNADWYLHVVTMNYDLPTYIAYLKTQDHEYLKHYGKAYDNMTSYSK